MRVRTTVRLFGRSSPQDETASPRRPDRVALVCATQNDMQGSRFARRNAPQLAIGNCGGAS
ncbi:MAG: hypothetical protein DMF03_06300 [Verrucomicrobia bacterium]|nr:MAG: hypothetical protein DMF03_06300 [Verrucomicrobiota bacterium]